MADPQLVLILLAPSQRCLRAADLEDEIVLVTAADLADRKAATCTVLEAYEHGCEIFSHDVDELALAASCLKRVSRSARLLSLLDNRGDVTQDVRHLQAGNVLRQIAPVRSDVGHRRRCAALFGIETPRIV